MTMHHVVSCDGGEEQYVKLTEEELSRLADIQAMAKERGDAEAAAAETREQAVEQLKAKATVNPDVALLAQALGLDLG